MSDALKRYMVKLASEPEALADFIKDPEKAAVDAGLSAEDRAVLTSGDQTKIYYALSGQPVPQVVSVQAGAVGQSPASAAGPGAQPSSPAAQQASPAYPMVVGWIGPNAAFAPTAAPAGGSTGAAPAQYQQYPSPYGGQPYPSPYPGQPYPGPYGGQPYPSPYAGQPYPSPYGGQPYPGPYWSAATGPWQGQPWSPWCAAPPTFPPSRG